jgi:glutamine synthetase
MTAIEPPQAMPAGTATRPRPPEVDGDQPSALGRLRAFVEERGIDTFRVGGVTTDGAWRGHRAPASAVLSGDQIAQADAVFGTDIQNDWYEPTLGFADAAHGLPDFVLRPDLSTVRAVPWAEGEGAVICDHVDWSGEPVEISPRHVLRRVVERCRGIGYEPVAAVELEFYVYRETPDSLREKGYTGLLPLSSVDSGLDLTLMADLLRRWTRALEEYGIATAGAGTELGPSHVELNLAHRPALEAADAAMLYKHALRELAAQDGLTVTFMARPDAARPPSSSHVHVSLWDGDRNAFWDREGARASATLRAYVAGAVAGLAELSLPALPTINSYRRIAPHLGTPTNMTWGYENRTTALRVISHQAGGSRVEHRLAGADANPYLSVAVALAGGIAGVEEGGEPPPEVSGDAWALSDREPVPTSLERAIELFEHSELAREWLGERFCDHYAATRRWELERFAQAVTDWERERYLERA